MNDKKLTQVRAAQKKFPVVARVKKANLFASEFLLRIHTFIRRISRENKEFLPAIRRFSRRPDNGYVEAAERSGAGGK